MTSGATEHIIQVTQPEWDRHGDTLVAALPDARWLIVSENALTLDGEIIDWEEARPTIAWFGYDGLRSSSQRRHFQLARSCGSLKFALTSYAGLDGQFWRDLHETGAVVTNAHLSGVPMSQFIMARVLELYHNPSQLSQSRDHQQWVSQPYREIDSSTWIVVGLGAIGTNVAKRAQAFGAHVVGVRRAVIGNEPYVDESVTLDTLRDVIGRGDVVVFAVPDSPETVELVDADLLSHMKPGATLVNVGRGTLIVEDHLRAALDAETLGAAILDVTSTEPLPDDHWIWDHPRVLFSSHTSAAGLNRHDRSLNLFVDNLHRIFAGTVPLTPFFQT